MKRIGRSIVAAGVVVLTAGLWPAEAAPSADKPDVWQCTEADCSSRRSVSESGVVSDVIRIRATASSNVGLSWVRLEARRDPGDWVCLRHWDRSGEEAFSSTYDWDTTQWPGSAGNSPGDCPSSGAYGDATRNGAYKFRVVARERVTDDLKFSSSYDVKVSNRPGTPSWEASPSVSGDTKGEPLVELKWNAVSAPDVHEYRFTRRDPRGNHDTFAVSADDPGGQGCDRNGSTYICYDDYFPSDGYHGTYEYVVVAYRSSPQGEQCELPPGGACVGGSAASPRQAKLRAKPPKPTPTPTKVTDDDRDRDSVRKAVPRRGRPVPAPNTDYEDFYGGTYEKTLPFGSRRVFTTPNGDERLGEGLDAEGRTPVASGPTGSVDTAATDPTQRRKWLSVAGGLILLMAAGHMSRVLRAR